LYQDFPSLAHLRAQQDDFSTEAVATKTPPAEPWAGFSAICDEGKMQLCAVSSWRPEEATEHLVSRMEANASLDLWRIAPSEDMAAQTNARMEGEDPGLTTCISLLEEGLSLVLYLALDLSHDQHCQSVRSGWTWALLWMAQEVLVAPTSSEA